MSSRFQNACHAVARTCTQHEKRIIAISSMVAIAVVSFGLGMLTQNATATAPLVVKYDGVCTVEGARAVAQPSSSEKGATQKRVATPKNDMSSCKYVGSKKSTKYYPPTCSFAKRIAPANLRCFTSDEDAQRKGYVRAAGC